eukprot:TRINITY_DN56_c0_g1_i1.p3 TRINITY_DN56_c0_g1~~TRINITY_DN56_c0_g1_i1.p3  ORF type:complete len:250 (+),score=101.98 TRINITY_DN56_c0_g1_i1:149-898(+)
MKSLFLAVLLIGAFAVDDDFTQNTLTSDDPTVQLDENSFITDQLLGDIPPADYLQSQPFLAETTQRALKWKCVDETGLNTAIAFDPVHKEIICIGDGVNCNWGLSSKDACNNAIQNTKAGGNYLRCGDHHKSIWGGGGYENDGHWCQKMLRMWVKCIDETGVKTALWRDPSSGDIVCLGDGSGNHCDWKLDNQDKCYQALKTYSSKKTYLTCGQDLLAKQGTDGYSYPNHYCRFGQALFKAGKWDQVFF